MGRASRTKRERRFNPPRPFVRMSLAEVSERQACERPYDSTKVKRDICKICKMEVFLHCADCEIQITGCLCLAVERMSDTELRQFKQQIIDRRAREAGLIIPK